MQLVVVTPPEPILTPADARAQLRLDSTAEDDVLTSLIAAATASIDGPSGWLGPAIGPQVLEWQGPDLGCGEILLPCPPVVAILSVGYLDPAEVPQVLDPSAWYLVDRSLILRPATPRPPLAPRRDAVRIRYRAGYQDDDGAAAVPAPIRQAILLMVTRLYANRGEDLPGNAVEDQAARNLLAPYRVFA